MATPTKKIKVTGRLEERESTGSQKKALFYRMMFEWQDENDQRQRKSRSTGLTVKGNKTKAEVLRC